MAARKLRLGHAVDRFQLEARSFVGIVAADHPHQAGAIGVITGRADLHLDLVARAHAQLVGIGEQTLRHDVLLKTNYETGQSLPVISFQRARKQAQTASS